MSFLSVSSEKTRVHLSPENLSTVINETTHGNHGNLSSDVAILPLYKSFIQIHKNSKDSWLNICKIKKENDNETIQVCVKNKVENLTAIAASSKKGAGLCFASGYANGKVKIRDLQTMKIVKDFPAPPSPSSVFFLDFNASDEHLASVYEDGLINIFGMQTSVKLQSYTLDKQSTLARFHPQKRSHLAVASFSGKVTLLDIYTKKVVFKADAHSAPCSDIAMSEDFLYTSGYDSLIKIFDLRKKSPGIQIEGIYGWTSIALSKCGAYLVGGNLKGELVSYDMRNLKKPLSSCRVEASNQKISRVAFLSDDDTGSSTADLSKAVRQSLCRLEEESEVKNIPESNDDFIEDILGFQRGRISDFSSSAINYASRVSTVTRRTSTDSTFNSYGKFNDFGSPEEVPESLDDSRVNKSRRKTIGKDLKHRASSVGAAIEELDEDKENDAKSVNCADIQESPLKDIVEVIEVETDESFKSVQNMEVPKKGFDLKKEFDALAEKFRLEVGSMNMDQNMRHIQLMSHVAEQRRQLQSRFQMVEECLMLLMNDDFKINLINDLTAENQQLKQQINDLTRRLSH